MPLPGTKLLIIGEAYGENEAQEGRPFVGAAGMELTRMLADAGLHRDSCFITNVTNRRPPQNNIDLWFLNKTTARKQGASEVMGRYPTAEIRAGLAELDEYIQKLQPDFILALGGTALWACTGKQGIDSYRGSLERSRWGIPLIATLHPARILRQWYLRHVAVHDMRKTKLFLEKGLPQAPEQRFIIRPSCETVIGTLQMLLGKLNQEPLLIALDIENWPGLIKCFGLAWSESDALCIPTAEGQNSYWPLDVELHIMKLVRQVLTHPNAQVVTQYGVHDCSYFIHHYGFCPQVTDDTYVAQHILFSSSPKSLNYLSSLYLPWHVYWKDENREEDPAEQRWTYNCKDVVATWSIMTRLRPAIERAGLLAQYTFQMEMFHHALRTMSRGIRIGPEKKKLIGGQVYEAITSLECWFERIIPLRPKVKPWYRSPIQQANYFYDVIGLQEVTKRDTGRRTFDDLALEELKKRHPELGTLFQALGNYRSLLIMNNLVNKKLDPDGRIRCTFNVAGTSTFRFSSSSDPFDAGTNLQNITEGTPDAKPYPIPNMRELFVPDTGHIFLEIDLKGADAMVVFAEAGEWDMVEKFYDPNFNLHKENAARMFALEKVEKSNDPTSPYHRAKQGCHATNYGCKAKTLSEHIQTNVAQAQSFIDRWFQLHPGIQQWHERVKQSLMMTRGVTNQYGYRIMFFDRPDSILPEALAAIPQSTVAITINKIWHNIVENLPWVQVLMQVHDSLLLQIPITMWERRKEIEAQTKIYIPYPKGHKLYIPVSMKMSADSWGKTEEREW